jgi:hypothetical protein
MIENKKNGLGFQSQKWNVDITSNLVMWTNCGQAGPNGDHVQYIQYTLCQKSVGDAVINRYNR